MSEVKRYGHIGYLVNASDGLCEIYPDMPVYVNASDFDAAQVELAIWKTKACEAAEREASLREELAGLQASCSIDRRHLDRMIDHGDDLQQRLTAAEQRNAELTQALERGKLWLELFRAWFGDYGVSKEDHMSIIRTLRSLPHPPTEFDNPTESGASE